MAKSNKCPALQQKGKVRIIAPSSACSQKEFVQSIEWLRSVGLEPLYRADLIDQAEFCYSDKLKQRVKDFKAALSERQSRLIWCLRGGYGALKLIPELKLLKNPTSPKVLVGLSDITVLHMIAKSLGLKTLHAPVLTRMARGIQPENLEILNLIFGRSQTVVFEGLVPKNKLAGKQSRMVGKVWGGNLTTLASLVGTKYQLKSKGSFVFLEDVQERGYRVDRYLEMLLQNGCFSGAKAIFFGDIVGGDEPDGKNWIDYVIKDFSSRVKIPVYTGIPSGHGEIQRPVPFGTDAVLDATFDSRTPKISLSVESPFL
ncbi:MAG: hypothetical protein COT74_11865 [Bdellovibrionales bacterium CG10_big_fil_rev_8_21_14_0_10_45_34]|nr:MAG: hypothetical protein COT74_11865 [Bdellovibrionales bacterium CG10_big_fil_rev_8_21_14_0_10_45_34]